MPNSYESSSKKIWVRADTPLGCGGIESFDANVNKQPVTNNINDSYTICFDPTTNIPVVLTADASNERFEWRNNTGVVLNMTSRFTLTQIGDYSLTIYKTENGIECSHTKNFTVVNPIKAKVTAVNVNIEDEKNNTIEVIVSGNSNYMFSLDNINFEGNSTSFTFTNIQNGLRTIYIRDVNNCEEPIEAKASILGYPKFFSPNGDNDNDYWNIKGLDADLYKAINIVIFNRFGVIIGKITDFNTKGWDGRFNGKLQQPNNYWFIAEIIDNNDNLLKQSGFFSLITD